MSEYIIEKIRALEFVCLDKPKNEDEQKEEDLYKLRLKNGETPLLDTMTRNMSILDSRAGYESLDYWRKNPEDYEAFHMAAHFSILGRIISDIKKGEVSSVTLEAFNDTTSCVENSFNVDEIRAFLIIRLEDGASKRHKREIPNTCGYVLAAAILKGGFSRAYSDQIRNMFPSVLLDIYKHKKETNDQLEKLKKFPQNIDTAMDRVRSFKRWGD